MRPGERRQAGVDGTANGVEDRATAARGELDVAEDHEGMELEGDLRRVGLGRELAGRLPVRHLLGEQSQPALAEGHGTVADRAWMGVELADGGDEEAAAGEDAFLDVVEK